MFHILVNKSKFYFKNRYGKESLNTANVNIGIVLSAEDINAAICCADFARKTLKAS